MLFRSGRWHPACLRPADFGMQTRRHVRRISSFILASAPVSKPVLQNLKNAGVTLNSAYLHPRSRGTVRLRSVDPTAAPLIDPNYWSDPHDVKMSIEGLKIAREIFDQAALKPFILAEKLPGKQVVSDQDLFDYGCANAKTDHHPVGTCKMGTGEDAVVGLDLKVHGLEGLRVCDSSVMPRVPSCNTNAPTIMVGKRQRISSVVYRRCLPQFSRMSAMITVRVHAIKLDRSPYDPSLCFHSL